MADKNTIQQMLESLVNDDQARAEELFHEYVVEKSREIYESLIEAEIEDDEEVEESTEDDEEETVEENFEDIAYEGDDEEADATDDFLGDVEVGDGEEGGEEAGPESLEDKVMDLEDAVEELEAKFAELQGEEEEEGHTFGDEEGEEGGFGGEEEVADSFDQELATVREYVEKVAGGHGAEKKGQGEKADNTKSTVASKNDMGGTAANILGGRNGVDGGQAGAAGGQLKGSSLFKGKPTEDNAGNINVPGGKAGNAFNKKEPGHGAEKSGSKESADNKQSLFRK